MSVKSPCSRLKIHVGKLRIILKLSLQSKQESKYDKVKSSKSLSPVGTTFRSCFFDRQKEHLCKKCVNVLRFPQKQTGLISFRL